MEAAPKGRFSRDYVLAERGMPVTELETMGTGLRGVTEFRIGGRPYRTGREGLTRRYRLETMGTPVARAVGRGLFRPRMEVSFEGGTCILRRRTVFSRSFVVLRGDTEVGSLERVGMMGRKWRVEIAAELPLEIRVFLFALALTLVRRRRARSSGGG